MDLELGARIAAWLDWKGWSQKQLADACGYSRAAVCQWVSGTKGDGTKKKLKASPSQKSLAAIVDALGISLEKFYGRVPKPRKVAA